MTALKFFSSVLVWLALAISATVFPKSVSVTQIANRFITPNGDSKNENAVIFLSNPQYSDVTGKIYDVQGKFIADMAFDSIVQKLTWDGRNSNGQAARSGVYVFVIQAEGSAYRGLLVVVR